MKKNLAKKITLSILAGAVLMSNSVVWAANPSTFPTKVTISGKDFYTPETGTVGTVDTDGTYDVNLAGVVKDTDDATGGKVTISGGKFAGTEVYGGVSEVGDTKHNEVVISGVMAGSTFGCISGGDAYGSNNSAENNRVTLSAENATYKKNIYGGYSNDGTAEGNTVTISGGTFDDNGTSVEVYGGFVSAGGDAIGNTVNISGGTFNGDIYGGRSYGGKVEGNTVNISDGTFENICIYGGYSAGGAVGGDAADKGNKVTISGGTFTYVEIHGGSSAGGNAKNNEVVISNVDANSTFGHIYGGASYFDLGSSSGSANYNKVTLSAGNVIYEENIYGGYAIDGDATGNIVTISGGKFGNGYNIAVYGGYAGGSGSAINNTVNIGGTADLSNANLFGGSNTEVGNVLNVGYDDELKAELSSKGIDVAVGAWQNKKVKGIGGFDVINFNYINWSNGGNVVETEGLELNNTKVGKVVIGSGTVKNEESMNLISVTNPVTDNFENQTNRDITIRTGLTTSETVKGDIELSGNNLKLTIDDAGIATEGIVAKVTDSSTDTGGVEPGVTIPDTGISGGTNVPTGASSFIDAVDKAGKDTVAYKVLDAVYTNYFTDEEQKEAVTNMLQLGEAGGQSATAANISRNVSAATVNRMSFGGRGGHHHRGGHGPADFNEKDGSAVWAQYVHGKDKVDGMALADGVTTSYESQFNGVVLGVDFKEVSKYQSGIAFNYGEGDSHTKNIALSRSDYDFWGIGYYGAVKNADSNVIFDINYAKSDSEVKQFNSGVELEAEPETTTISAGVKVEKLIDKGAMQFVPYAGLRFMSVDTDEYSATYLGKEAFNYSADRQNIWLLPVGVSFRQENVYDSGWVVTPKVDLSYIWAFGDTENEMTVRTPDVAEAARLGYTVMNDGSFLGSIGLEAEKGDWTFGVAYSYQKSSDSRSDRWYVDAKYSF